LDHSRGNPNDFLGFGNRKSEAKPRLNYELLIAKAQKKVNGTDKEKIDKPKEFDPAKPDHIYEGDQVAIRSLYNEIVKK